jgi:hypothetical protein
MQANKKLISCSILAITIGIASIVPLAFFMSPAKAQSNDVPWFNVDVPFAYYSATSSEPTNKDIPYLGVLDDVVSYSSSYAFGLDYTVNPEVTEFADARVEYFQIHVYSDLGFIEDITTSYGANCTGKMDPTTMFSFACTNWFNTTASSGGTYITNFNGTLPDDNGPAGGISGASSSGCFANTTLPQKILNAQNAKTIYVDISRLGYVTVEDDNNTVFTLADHTVIQHVELTKNGGGFSFGDVPADRIENLTLPEPNP